MFVNTGVAPVISFGDYTLHVVPQDGYLKIDGEYHISSNMTILDNVIELRHKLPSQLVDKVFLKTTGRSCNSSYSNLKCFVYKSSSFIDIKNDESLISKRKNNNALLLETNFSINNQISRNLTNHNSRWTSDLVTLKSQLSKNIFKDRIPLKNYYLISSKDIGKSSDYLVLDLTKSLTLKSDGKREYSYQKVGLYIPKLAEILSGSSLLGIWEIPEGIGGNTTLRVRTLEGNLLLKNFNDNQYRKIDLKLFNWKSRKDQQSIVELLQDSEHLSWSKTSIFLEGKLDIVMSISKNDWTNIVQLKVDLVNQNKNLGKEVSLISINPHDPLFKRFKLDHTWIVEKM